MGPPTGGGWRERRQLTEARQRATLAEYDELAEAARLDTRMVCARRLADRAAAELVSEHQQLTELAGSDTALEMDLRDIERVLKAGYQAVIRFYLSRW